MNILQIHALKKSLTEGLRIRLSNEVVIPTVPNMYLIEKQNGHRCLGLLKRWEIIGLFHERQVSSPTIWLHKRYLCHQKEIEAVLIKAQLDEIVSIQAV